MDKDLKHLVETAFIPYFAARKSGFNRIESMNIQLVTTLTLAPFAYSLYKADFTEGPYSLGRIAISCMPIPFNMLIGLASGVFDKPHPNSLLR